MPAVARWPRKFPFRGTHACGTLGKYHGLFVNRGILERFPGIRWHLIEAGQTEILNYVRQILHPANSSRLCPPQESPFFVLHASTNAFSFVADDSASRRSIGILSHVELCQDFSLRTTWRNPSVSKQVNIPLMVAMLYNIFYKLLLFGAGYFPLSNFIR